MTRHRHFAARLTIAGALLALSSSFGAMAQGAGESALADGYAASEPAITSDLSKVPDFTPVLSARPYKVSWQQQLLSYRSGSC